MKILCVHQGSELYGSDRSFIQSVKVIRDNYPNAQLDIVLPNKGPLVGYLNDICDQIIFQDVGNISRNNFKKHPIRSIFHVYKKSIDAYRLMKKYDVIYLNTIVVFSFIFAGIFTKKSIIHHIREAPNSILEKKVFSKIFNLSKSNLIFNSEYSYNNLKPLLKTNSAYVHNGVEPLKISIENKLEKRKLKLLCVGRINGWKGQEIAVEVIKYLRKDGIDAYLKILGSPPKEQDFHLKLLQQKIKDFDLSKYIQLIDFLDDPSELYNWSNIVIVPSKLPEPFGRVAIEAQSIGRPVVASNNGGLKEIIKDNFGGVLCEPSNPIDFYKKINDLIYDEDNFNNKCQEALINYKTRFSNIIYEKNFIKIFNSYIED
ncbi:glycosyltransferase family 4 protein [Providencia huaxiensis]|uniref:glycosyltransferase family 4 protein n=1 Tax=Providencia huaxiensis TaxID=2027290 RepID=UPI0034E39B9B